MLTLRLAGGSDVVYEGPLDSLANLTSDGAAVLVEDGTLIGAVEEAGDGLAGDERAALEADPGARGSHRRSRRPRHVIQDLIRQDLVRLRGGRGAAG